MQFNSGYSRQRNRPKKTADIEPILYILKREFFHLSTNDLEKFFCLYGEMYGESTLKYARANYHCWKTGYKSLGVPTLMKLAELLPYILPFEKRENLLTILLNANKRSLNKCSRHILSSWATYKTDFQAVKKSIYQKRPEYQEKTLQSIALPKRLYHIASWLLKNDMQMAITITNNAVVSDVNRQIFNATNDLTILEQKCDNILAATKYPQAITIDLHLPTEIIFISIPEKKQSFFEKLKDLI